MTEEITIRSATADDLEPLRTLVTNVIARDTQMYAHLELPPEKYATIYDELARGIDLDTSMIACTPSKGIVACVLCGPYGVSLDEKRVHSDCGPILAVYGTLNNWADKNLVNFSQERVLRVMVGAAKDDYRSKGIGGKLGAAVLSRAREAGWDMMVIRCTSATSQHLARDVFGGTAAEEVVYNDVEWRGKRVFEGLKGSAMLLYKRIGRTAKL